MLLKNFSHGVIKRRRLVIAIFAAAAAISALLMLGVRVSYKMTEYLPSDAESTQALEIMKEEFGGALQDTRVMITGVTLPQALEFKERLAAVSGVSGVVWLDDAADLTLPVETLDPATVANYWRDGKAVFDFAVESGREVEVLKEIRALSPDNIAIAGEAVSSANSQAMAVRETLKAMAFLLPIILIILFCATESWIEPVLFLAAIGAAVVINMGTNIFFGKVSFITWSISPILQLAVSLDYAIFLLRSFSKFRAETGDTESAMRRAIRRSIPAVLASALTTLFGFLALVVMRFRIGADLGLNLAKGIALSFVSAMIFLPALTVACVKLIDKTRHRPIAASFKRLGRFAVKSRWVWLALVAVVIVPAFLAQRLNTFTYGMGGFDADSKEGMEQAAVEEAFGRRTPIVLLLPRGDAGREARLCAGLEALPGVQAVVSYVTAAGAEIPPEFVGEAAGQFLSERYSRIIVYADTESEGENAFSVVESVRAAAKLYYPGAMTLGPSANIYDIKTVVEADSTLVNLLAVGAIFIVLVLTFRSILKPLLLVLTIEASIWINLSVPYIGGGSLCYLGYLVISTVQLGATVDYAILLADHYRENRALLDPRPAAAAAVSDTASPIIMSAAILSSAGFVVGLVSSNSIVSQLGYLLGRGALLSAALVLCFLPAALSVFERKKK